MKHNMFRNFGVWLLAALLMVACSEDKTEPAVAPDFPASATVEVAAGEVYTFTIAPNTSWTLALTDASVSFFTLLDGESEVYRLRGEAGTHEISVCVSSFDEFDKDRTGELELTLGTGSLQSTRTILTLTRKALARELSVLLAEYDAENENFARDEESALLYGAAIDQMEYIYDAYNYVYLQRFAVEANFQWVFTEVPAWFGTNEVTEGEAGRTEIFSRVNAEAHPFTETSFELGFLDVSNPNKPELQPATVTVTLPGCEEFCVVNRIDKEVVFDKNGAFDNNGSLVETGVLGDMMAPLGAKLCVAAKVEDRYSFLTEDTEWITVTEELPQEASTEYGIWSRDLTIVAAPNTEGAREAVLVAVPQSTAKTLTALEELLTEDLTAFKEASYVVSTLKQESGLPEDFEAVEAVNISDLEGWGSTFASLPTGEWPWMNSWATIPYAYKLTHTSVEAISDFFVNVEYASYRIFGFNGEDAEYEDLSSCWIALEEGQLEGSTRVKMRLGEEYPNTLAGPDGENEATIVFYNANGVAQAMIYCVLTKSSTPGGNTGNKTVTLVDAKAAAAAGVYLEPVVEGDEHYSPELAYMGIPQFYVYFKKGATVALNVPTYIYGMSYDPEWLNLEQTSESVVTLTATETTAGKSCGVSLYASMGLMGAEEAAHLTCVFDPSYIPVSEREPEYNPNGAITFKDMEAAEALGASLYAMPESDDDYSYNLEYSDVPQFILKLRKEGSITLKVPAYYFGWEYTNGTWLSFTPNWVEDATEITISMRSISDSDQVTFISLYRNTAMDDEATVAQIKCILKKE